jgi:hypothetical protein
MGRIRWLVPIVCTLAVAATACAEDPAGEEDLADWIRDRMDAHLAASPALGWSRGCFFASADAQLLMAHLRLPDFQGGNGFLTFPVQPRTIVYTVPGAVDGFGNPLPPQTLSTSYSPVATLAPGSNPGLDLSVFGAPAVTLGYRCESGNEWVAEYQYL